MKRYFKILPIICLLAAQIIVAVHIHNADDTVTETQCVYCQAATELSGADTPEVLMAAEPVYYQTTEVVSLSQNIVYFNL